MSEIMDYRGKKAIIYNQTPELTIAECEKPDHNLGGLSIPEGRGQLEMTGKRIGLQDPAPEDGDPEGAKGSIDDIGGEIPKAAESNFLSMTGVSQTRAKQLIWARRRQYEKKKNIHNPDSQPAGVVTGGLRQKRQRSRGRNDG